MLDRGIATRRGIMCAHLEPAYAGAEMRFALPRSEAAHRQVILLPLYPQMMVDDQQRIVSTLREATSASSTGAGTPVRAVANG